MAPRHPKHRLLKRRIHRTCYYGKYGRINQLSLPITETVADYFDKHSPFDYLDMDFATNLSREACIDPCTLIVAMVYLERLRTQPGPAAAHWGLHGQMFDRATPNELYLAALLVAAKYMHDDGTDEYVYNDEWACSSGLPLADVNRAELRFLQAVDWRLTVSPAEFTNTLHQLERSVALRQSAGRASTTYADLRAMARRPMGDSGCWWSACLQPFLAAFGLASLFYTAGVVTLLAAALPRPPVCAEHHTPPLVIVPPSAVTTDQTYQRQQTARKFPCPPILKESEMPHRFDEQQEPTTTNQRSVSIRRNAVDAALDLHIYHYDFEESQASVKKNVKRAFCHFHDEDVRLLSQLTNSTMASMNYFVRSFTVT